MSSRGDHPSKIAEEEGERRRVRSVFAISGVIDRDMGQWTRISSAATASRVQTATPDWSGVGGQWHGMNKVARLTLLEEEIGTNIPAVSREP